LWETPEYRNLSENWEREEPPTGECWQLWETVSEGSPISPVFATREEFVDWLVAEGYSRLAAENFAKDGWAPSMVISRSEDGGITISNDIEACGAKEG
jgi:hypothetical protein